MIQFEFEKKPTQALLNNLKALGGAEFDEMMKKSIKRTTNSILAQAQKNLTANKSRVTSLLFKSGRVSDPTVTGTTAESSVTFESDHAWYVEFGRRAGKYPPLADILQWVRRRGLTQESEELNLAKTIRWSIGKKGTKANPFFYPALQDKMNVLLSDFKQQYNDYISKLNQG